MIHVLLAKRQPNRFQVSQVTKKLINFVIGYAGYVPGVKSENLYGQTYGKTSYASSANTFHRGIDQPSHIKYNTQMKSEFIKHNAKEHETTA